MYEDSIIRVNLNPQRQTGKLNRAYVLSLVLHLISQASIWVICSKKNWNGFYPTPLFYSCLSPQVYVPKVPCLGEQEHCLHASSLPGSKGRRQMLAGSHGGEARAALWRKSLSTLLCTFLILASPRPLPTPSHQWSDVHCFLKVSTTPMSHQEGRTEKERRNRGGRRGEGRKGRRRGGREEGAGKCRKSAWAKRESGLFHVSRTL